jgi:hypothetical protein
MPGIPHTCKRKHAAVWIQKGRRIHEKTTTQITAGSRYMRKPIARIPRQPCLPPSHSCPVATVWKVARGSRIRKFLNCSRFGLCHGGRQVSALPDMAKPIRTAGVREVWAPTVHREPCYFLLRRSWMMPPASINNAPRLIRIPHTMEKGCLPRVAMIVALKSTEPIPANIAACTFLGIFTFLDSEGVNPWRRGQEVED